MFLKYLSRLLQVTLLLVALPTFANPVSLTNLLATMQSMQADIVQTIYDNHGKAIQKTTGTIALQRPGKFRWEVKKPIPQLIIANQNKIWIYDADLEQVTIRALDQEAGETPALLLSSNDDAIAKNFNVTENDNASEQTFTLLPKKKDSIFESVQMKFTNGQLQSMQLKDSLGHVTMIAFKNAKINTTLSPKLFIFTPPANVDVIDETKKR